MVYIPNPDDITNPTDAITAESAQAEFRALKGKIQGMTGLIASWNGNDKSALIGLSSGALLATNINSVNGSIGCRANMGVAPGQHIYYEATLTTFGGANLQVGMAQLTSGFVLNNQMLGTDTLSYAFNTNGTSYHNGVSTPFGVQCAQGDVIGVEIDNNGGNMNIYRNGSFIGNMFPGFDTTKTWYPALSLTGVGDQVLGNFGNLAFAETQPPGATTLTNTTVFMTGLQNIVYNGRMELDQQNAGAAQNAIANGAYMVDGMKFASTQAGKWTAQQNANAITPPPQHVAYQGITCISAYTSLATDVFTIGHMVEGYSINRLDYGKNTARTCTLSFWVYSSITGLHSGCVVNAAGARSYPFQFLIGTANTWTPVSIVIPGDTQGTWLTTNTLAMIIKFNLGSGSNFLSTANSWQGGNFVGVTNAVNLVATNGATFYLTGLSFREGIFGIGQSPERITADQNFEKCIRYYNKFGMWVPTTNFSLTLPTQMRIGPTITGGGAGFASATDGTAQIITVSQTGAASQTLTLDARM